VLTLRSLIVETNGHVVLVDTGWVISRMRSFSGMFTFTTAKDSGGLRNRGYEPEDITDVVLTHLSC